MKLVSVRELMEIQRMAEDGIVGPGSYNIDGTEMKSNISTSKNHRSRNNQSLFGPQTTNYASTIASSLNNTMMWKSAKNLMESEHVKHNPKRAFGTGMNKFTML